MSIADRIAAWFGYVPREHYEAVCDDVDALYEQAEMNFQAFERASNALGRLTETAVKPRPEIIVSADFKRGIPCS